MCFLKILTFSIVELWQFLTGYFIRKKGEIDFFCIAQILISQNTSINTVNISTVIFKSQDFIAILMIFVRAGGYLWF